MIMRTIECIRFRSCQPIGQMLAKHLLDQFSSEARSRGLKMTVWLDNELPGDLCVHLEYERCGGKEEQSGSIGLAVEQMLETQGLVSRRVLLSASEID
jgi:hypothetical protein